MRIQLSLIATALFVAPAPAQADKPVLSHLARVAAGKSVAEDAAMLRREAPLQPWRPVKKGETLFTRDLIVGMPGAALESKDGSVRLLLLADLDQRSPFPVMEAAVVLHPATDVDLDVTLDRGRVDVINAKTSGPAKVRVRLRGRTLPGGEQPPTLTLAEPGTRLALELYGRWPKGVPFLKEPPATHRPAADLVALVVKGQVEVKHGRNQFLMKEPPGPAIIYRSVYDENDPVPEPLDALPPWAFPEKVGSERGKAATALIERFRKVILEKSLGAALDEFLASDDPNARAVALTLLGATDDVVRLGMTIRQARHPDVWERGVLVLRHWLGRAPAHDLMLYEILVKTRKMKPNHAETVMQLLHSFSDEDLARPETYETLVEYLDHEELPIRGLAHWHLVRLAPRGRDIKYDPLAPKEERDAARKKWQALIPAGKLPPKAATAK